MPAVPRRFRRTAVVLAALPTLVLAGCGAGHAPSPSAPPRSAPVATVAASCAPVAGFGCEWAPRFAAVQRGGDAMLDRFRTRFGMRSVAFQPGYTDRTYWGFLKCSTADLAAMTRYVTDRAAPADRAYLVGAMRGVADNQHWGVWAAGADRRPGTKNGWSSERDEWGEHRVTATTGFAGPGERYVVAVTDQQPSPGSLPGGVHTVSDLVALLFGEPVPAPVTVPEPDD